MYILFQFLQQQRLQRLPRERRGLQSEVERRTKDEAAIHRRPDWRRAASLQLSTSQTGEDARIKTWPDLFLSSKALEEKTLSVPQVLHAAETSRTRCRGIDSNKSG